MRWMADVIGDVDDDYIEMGVGGRWSAEDKSVFSYRLHQIRLCGVCTIMVRGRGWLQVIGIFFVLYINLFS